MGRTLNPETDMNATNPHPDALPRGLLIAIGVMVVVTLLGVTAVRLSGVSIHTPDAQAVASRSLRFEDGPDGSVAILDGRSGREVERVQGEAGFLRGALRALSRERRMRNLGSEAPFDLIARADGRLTLADPATGERIDLESFGHTNAATFARLLTVNPAATRSTR
jgi:putative photosynthetic complex assembly protein